MQNKIIKTISFFTIIAIFILVSCEKEDFVTTPTSITDQQALEELVSQDAVLLSFDVNYNEGAAMSLSKVATTIYPIKIGRKIELVSRNLSVTTIGDSAHGVLSSVYNGTLFIAASWNYATPGDTTEIDTLIQKSYTTTVTRNITFKKIASTDNPRLNWKITSISLPEGQTAVTQINISKVVLFKPSGDSLVITNPNDYYLKRDTTLKNTMPVFGISQSIKIRVELSSTRSDTDFVTLFWGATFKDTTMRAKRKFNLVSSTDMGGVYFKVYEQAFVTNTLKGFKHVIIDAIQRPVILDDAAEVQHNAWGVPYIIR